MFIYLFAFSMGTLAAGIGCGVYLAWWQGRASKAAFPGHPAPPWLDQIEKRFIAGRVGRRVQRNLLRLDWRYPAIYWAGMWCAAAVLCILLFHSILVVGWLVAVPLALTVILVTAQYTRSRLRTRFVKLLAAALPEASRLVANGIEAGLGMRDALWIAGTELPDPVGPILGRAVSELDMGTPLAEVLLRLEERFDCRELTLFCRAALMHAQLGGQIASALRGLSTTLLERAEVADEVIEHLTETRVTSLLLPLMPIGLALVLNLMMPGFLAPLSTGPGMMLGGAFLVAEVLLFVLCRAIITIPV